MRRSRVWEWSELKYVLVVIVKCALHVVAVVINDNVNIPFAKCQKGKSKPNPIINSA